MPYFSDFPPLSFVPTLHQSFVLQLVGLSCIVFCCELELICLNRSNKHPQVWVVNRHQRPAELVQVEEMVLKSCCSSCCEHLNNRMTIGINAIHIFTWFGSVFGHCFWQFDCRVHVETRWMSHCLIDIDV